MYLRTLIAPFLLLVGSSTAGASPATVWTDDAPCAGCGDNSTIAGTKARAFTNCATSVVVSKIAFDNTDCVNKSTNCAESNCKFTLKVTATASGTGCGTVGVITTLLTGEDPTNLNQTPVAAGDVGEWVPSFPPPHAQVTTLIPNDDAHDGDITRTCGADVWHWQIHVKFSNPTTDYTMKSELVCAACTGP